MDNDTIYAVTVFGVYVDTSVYLAKNTEDANKIVEKLFDDLKVNKDDIIQLGDYWRGYSAKENCDVEIEIHRTHFENLP